MAVKARRCIRIQCKCIFKCANRKLDHILQDILHPFLSFLLSFCGCLLSSTFFPFYDSISVNGNIKHELIWFFRTHQKNGYFVAYALHVFVTPFALWRCKMVGVRVNVAKTLRKKLDLNGCVRSWFHGYLMHHDANIQSNQRGADPMCNSVWRANRNQFWFLWRTLWRH